MTPTIQALGIDKLSVDEQLALVRAIWDHIAESGPIPRLRDARAWLGPELPWLRQR